MNRVIQIGHQEYLLRLGREWEDWFLASGDADDFIFYWESDTDQSER